MGYGSSVVELSKTRGGEGEEMMSSDSRKRQTLQNVLAWLGGTRAEY
jgi:hypothetical protein